MSDKPKPPKVVHKPGEFQLDKKELLETVPLMLKGLAGQAIDFANELDADHNGTSDLAQFMPFILKALPFISAMSTLVKPEGVKVWVLSHAEWFHDERCATLAAEHLDDLLKLLSEAQAAVGK